MATTPSQSAEIASELASELAAELGRESASAFIAPPGFTPASLEQLWQESQAEFCGLTQTEFSSILLELIAAQNEKQLPNPPLSLDQQATFLHTLKLADLILAQACARGHERAWERFLNLYQQPLTRAAIAIANSETLGRDLADALYAELYGLTSHSGERAGQRRCPLSSYQGRGSLLGWLRTTLAQRHVDHHRRTHRETSLDTLLESSDPPAQPSQPESTPAEPSQIAQAVAITLNQHPPEDRFLLSAYYLDQHTLHQIGQLLHVHEATISRKLHRLTKDLRKQLLSNLQSQGLSKRAAEEALTTDPRDIELDLRKILQTTQSGPFPDQAFPEKTGQ